MNSLTFQRIIKGLAIIGIVIFYVMPGEVIGLLTELFHAVWELFVEFLHILFEWIEVALDHVVEHLFETDLHNTQIIVFYILVSVAFYGLYRLLRKVPGVLQRLKSNLIAAWEFNKIRTLLYWRGLSSTDKAKLIAIAIGAVAGFIFLNF